MTEKLEPKIIVEKDGPYHVQGGIPLIRKEQVVSEYGEPLTWKKTGVIPTEETYKLCRCGKSKDKPFCDSSHTETHFEACETADPAPSATRQQLLPGGQGIFVRRDNSLCMESGFCATRLSTIDTLVPKTADPQVRAQVMRMVEHCPSSSLYYSLEENGPDIEPDLPQAIAVTTEITSRGPIPGPLWIMGYIPVELPDGRIMEVRNRATLCVCGESINKPLCDGTHRHLGR